MSTGAPANHTEQSQSQTNMSNSKSIPEEAAASPPTVPLTMNTQPGGNHGNQATQNAQPIQVASASTGFNEDDQRNARVDARALGPQRLNDPLCAVHGEGESSINQPDSITETRQVPNTEFEDVTIDKPEDDFDRLNAANFMSRQNQDGSVVPEDFSVKEKLGAGQPSGSNGVNENPVTGQYGSIETQKRTPEICVDGSAALTQ